PSNKASRILPERTEPLTSVGETTHDDTSTLAAAPAVWRGPHSDGYARHRVSAGNIGANCHLDCGANCRHGAPRRVSSNLPRWSPGTYPARAPARLRPGAADAVPSNRSGVQPDRHRSRSQW